MGEREDFCRNQGQHIPDCDRVSNPKVLQYILIGPGRERVVLSVHRTEWITLPLCVARKVHEVAAEGAPTGTLAFRNLLWHSALPLLTEG